MNELEKDLENELAHSPENEELDELIDQIKAKNDNSSVYSPYDSDIDDKNNLDIDSPSSLGIRANKNNLVDLEEDNQSLELRKQQEISDYIKNSNSVAQLEPESDHLTQMKETKFKKDAKIFTQGDKTVVDKSNTITTATTYAKSYLKTPNVIKKIKLINFLIFSLVGMAG